MLAQKENMSASDSICAEELADVQLGIYYVQEICGIATDDLHKAMNVKMKRLEKIMAKKGKI